MEDDTRTERLEKLIGNPSVTLNEDELETVMEECEHAEREIPLEELF